MAKKKIWTSKEERDAWERHVDETIARMRSLAERALADLERKQAAEKPSSG